MIATTDRPLAPKRARFVEEYLVDLNATQAAIRAGYSARTAHQTGYELLRNPEVHRVVAEKAGELIRRTEINQEAVLEETRMLAFHPIRPGVLSAGEKLRALDMLGRYLDLWSGGGAAPPARHIKEIIVVDRRPKMIDSVSNGPAQDGARSERAREERPARPTARP